MTPLGVESRSFMNSNNTATNYNVYVCNFLPDVRERYDASGSGIAFIHEHKKYNVDARKFHVSKTERVSVRSSLLLNPVTAGMNYDNGNENRVKLRR